MVLGAFSPLFSIREKWPKKQGEKRPGKARKKRAERAGSGEKGFKVQEGRLRGPGLLAPFQEKLFAAMEPRSGLSAMAPPTPSPPTPPVPALSRRACLLRRGARGQANPLLSITYKRLVIDLERRALAKQHLARCFLLLESKERGYIGDVGLCKWEAKLAKGGGGFTPGDLLYGTLRLRKAA